VIFFTFALGGCTGHTALQTLADRNDIQLDTLKVREHQIRVLQNHSASESNVLTIYFGGDGRPWREGEPASNPDGRGVLAAELAIKDPRLAFYLGRPCYHRADIPPECKPEMWTSHRYSSEIVKLMAGAVSELLHRESAEYAELIGFSGGGVLALLIAAQLDAVTRVSTIAANLDTEAWVGYHELLPLTGSLNPADSLHSPTQFEQVHLTGTLDKVVPARTIANFRNRHPEAVYLEVEGFDHRCCWLEHWPSILDHINRDIESLRVSPTLPPAAPGDR